MAAKGHDRINVQNNPVNRIDPFGLTDDPKSWPDVTYYMIPIIEAHLNNIDIGENLCPSDQEKEHAMVNRLRKGKKTFHDYEFMMHEIIEADIMRTRYNNEYTGDNIAMAHIEALETRNVKPHEIWHPKVLKQYRDHFPHHWERYWK